jgi:hypothetical protein
MGMNADDVIESPLVLAGDLAGITDQLVASRERFGVSYVTLSEDFAFQLAPIIPALTS